jgi:hypothetical protein
VRGAWRRYGSRVREGNGCRRNPGWYPAGHGRGHGISTSLYAPALAIHENILVVLSADAVIAIGGKYGTLSEIAVALKAGRPVYGITPGISKA